MKKVIFVLVLAMAVSASYGVILFEDDFTEGKLNGWKKPGDEWLVRNKVLNADSKDGAVLMVDGVNDVNIEMQVEVKAVSKVIKAGFVFRAVESGDGPNGFKGYYAGIDTENNQAIWESYGNESELVASKPGEIVSDRWYKLRLLAAGDHIVLYIDNMKESIVRFPKIDGIHSGFSSGQIGLRALGGKVSFRNFKVKEYSPAVLEKSYTNPVQDGCADPVVKLFGGTYYLYCTYTLRSRDRVQGIRLFTSTNLVEWEDRGFALKDSDSWGRRGFWAPDIVEKDGVYYLYYAAEERMCVATAKTPLGPFRQKIKKPIEPDSIKIDGHVFKDEDGNYYFYYVHFNNGNEIWGGKLNDDMVTVDESSLKLMVKPDQPWEQHMTPVVEGPEIIKHKGTYYLTYSGSHFKSPEYAVGYATSESPLGPWEKYKYNPIMKSTSYAHGTAHHTLATSPDGKDMFIVYHRHYSLDQANPRKLAVDRIQFVPKKSGPDILEIWGPTSSPQPVLLN